MATVSALIEAEQPAEASVLLPEPDNLRRQVVLTGIRSLTHEYILGAATWGQLPGRLVVRATVSPSEGRRFRSCPAAALPRCGDVPASLACGGGLARR